MRHASLANPVEFAAMIVRLKAVAQNAAAAIEELEALNANLNEQTASYMRQAREACEELRDIQAQYRAHIGNGGDSGGDAKPPR